MNHRQFQIVKKMVAFWNKKFATFDLIRRLGVKARDILPFLVWDINCAVATGQQQYVPVKSCMEVTSL